MGCVFGTRVRYPFGGQYDIMSASEREQAKPAHRERRMPIMNEVHDILKVRNERSRFWDRNF